MTYKIYQQGLWRSYHVSENDRWIASFRSYQDATAFVDIKVNANGWRALLQKPQRPQQKH
jgi:hypothetical protein